MSMTCSAAAPAREAPPDAFRSAPAPAQPHGGWAARVTRFNPDRALAAPQTSLAAPGRAKTSEQTDIGALFADRLMPTCR